LNAVVGLRLRGREHPRPGEVFGDRVELEAVTSVASERSQAVLRHEPVDVVFGDAEQPGDLAVIQDVVRFVSHGAALNA